LSRNLGVYLLCKFHKGAPRFSFSGAGVEELLECDAVLEFVDFLLKLVRLGKDILLSIWSQEQYRPFLSELEEARKVNGLFREAYPSHNLTTFPRT
jgi:hypothetical protein